MIQCTKCKETKSEDKFSSDKLKRNGYCSQCRECKNIYSKQYGEDNKILRLAKAKKRYAANPEINKKKSSDWKNTKRKDPIAWKAYVKNHELYNTFGITLDQYNQMFDNQNGCCQICSEHQIKFKRALSVDHNHDTGEVRGLLCSRCNTGIGQLRDSIELLEKAIVYLKKYDK